MLRPHRFQAPGSRTSAAPTLDADFAGSSELELKTKNRKYDRSNISESVATDLIMILTMILMMMMMMMMIMMMIMITNMIASFWDFPVSPLRICGCHHCHRHSHHVTAMAAFSNEAWEFMSSPTFASKNGIGVFSFQNLQKCENMSLLCSWAVSFAQISERRC